MKKYITLLLTLSMLSAFSACSDASYESSSESESIVEETTSKVTESTTEKVSEPTTGKKADTTLNEKISLGEISFKIPANYTLETTQNGDHEILMYTFDDSSFIQAVVVPNTSGTDFSSLSEVLLDVMLEEYATSFSSTQGYDDVSELEFFKINNVSAVRQELTVSIIKSVVCHFIYNENIYSICFSKYSENHTLAYDIREDVIDTIKFTSSTNSSDTIEEKDIENQVSTQPNISVGQSAALDSANSYIKHSSFSYQGLIEQLEFEGFSHDESVYAADNCGADWNAEALESAKSYIDYSGFSYTGLIEQLEYEDFTHDQAVYGADNCVADWNEEAAESAESYMNYSSMSRDELYDQLLYEGFTVDQATYGLQAVGY